MHTFKLMLSAIFAIPGSCGRRASAALLALMSIALLTPCSASAQTTALPPLTASQLTDIEAIHQLKAQYFRYIDTKDWTDFGNVFASNATVQATALGITVNYAGRSQIVSSVSGELALAVTVHHGFMPEITLTSDTTASGIWAMEDLIEYTPLIQYHGYGQYHETYVKINGQWFIQSTVLTRFREDVEGLLTVGPYI